MAGIIFTIQKGENLKIIHESEMSYYNTVNSNESLKTRSLP